MPMLDQSRINPSELHEMEEHWETVHRCHRILAICGVIVVLVLIGLIWYNYPQFQRSAAVLAQIPGVQTAVANLGDRVNELDTKFERRLNDQRDLRDQVTKLGQRMETRLQSLRRQAQETSALLLHRVQAEVDSRLQSVHAQLARLETATSNGQTRMAELQQELTQVRGEMAKQAAELRDVRNEMDQSRARQDQQFVTLNDREERDRRDVDTVAQKLAVERVDFEVTKNHSQVLAAGISLGITGTDVRYRRVSGWMWVMPDRRTIWLREQGAQQPVVYYGSKDGKRRELVITNVTKNSVSGYLLLPRETA